MYFICHSKTVRGTVFFFMKGHSIKMSFRKVDFVRGITDVSQIHFLIGADFDL